MSLAVILRELEVGLLFGFSHLGPLSSEQCSRLSNFFGSLRLEIRELVLDEVSIGSGYLLWRDDMLLELGLIELQLEGLLAILGDEEPLSLELLHLLLVSDLVFFCELNEGLALLLTHAPPSFTCLFHHLSDLNLRSFGLADGELHSLIGEANVCLAGFLWSYWPEDVLEMELAFFGLRFLPADVKTLGAIGSG